MTDTSTGPAVEPGGPRWVTLDGAHNARDIGGIPGTASNGASCLIRPGRLFRSDHLDNCTAADLERLRQLGLATVIDLRVHAREREHPDHALPIAAQVRLLNLPMMRDYEAITAVLRTVAEQGMGAFYLEIARWDRDQIVQVFRALAAHCTAPVWWHCTTGKDRTGLIAALLLMLLGAEDEAIVADYGSSVVQPEAVAAHIQRQGWRPEGLPSAHLRADPEAMREFLAAFVAEFGSAEQWLRAGGLEAEHIAVLRHELLIAA